MTRSISQSLRRALEEPRSSEYIVIMLEIDHPSLNEPIRVANDVVDYEYENNLYVGFPFVVEIVSDTTSTPRGQLSIQNVDQRIGEALIDLTTPPSLRILLFANSDFTELSVASTNRLRIPILDSITPEYEAVHLVFSNVSVNAMTITGEITSYDMSNEPWPAIRSTADRLPGLDP